MSTIDIEASADACRTHEPIVPSAQTIVRPHRRIGRTQAGEAGNRRLEFSGDPTEMSASAAIGGPGRRHCPSRFQKGANTCVESTKPRTTLTTTPSVKA